PFLHFARCLLRPPSFPTRRSSDLLRLLLQLVRRPRNTATAGRHPPKALFQRRTTRILCQCERTLKNASRNARRRVPGRGNLNLRDRKSTRLNSSHVKISYAVFCLQ